MKKIIPGALLVLALPYLAHGQDTQSFDLVFRGGTIIDGTGSDRYKGDVGIIGDEVVAIGDLTTATATRDIDAAGLIISPGFIDLHAHVTDGVYGRHGLLSSNKKKRAAQNYVAQGVTTLLGNPDGYQSRPIPDLRDNMERNGIGPNIALTNGHNGLRDMVLSGDRNREATPEEIAEMKDILLNDMANNGSFGLSVGTEYTSGKSSNTAEQVELAKTLPEYNGIFIAHMRSQGDAPMWFTPSRFRGITPPNLEGAIDEMITVADETGARTVITHMKAWGSYRGNGDKLMERIQTARDGGSDIYIDVYPYDSSGSDGRFSAVPDWAYGFKRDGLRLFTNYRRRFRTRFNKLDEQGRKDLEDDVLHKITARGGPRNILILDYPDESFVGKTLADFMEARELSAVDATIAMQLEGYARKRNGAQLRSISMAERDIETFLSQPWAATSTDGWVVLPEQAVGRRKYSITHRRCFGSFPRRIAHYSQFRGLDTLEQAIRSVAGLPAEILSIEDRGLLKAGMKADITVIDLENLKDNTTYLDPSMYPSGIPYVLVNGTFVVDEGERTLALPGSVLSSNSTGRKS
ncbi:MAG: amidohydrolase family protein [Pseudomonadota bacterium]